MKKEKMEVSENANDYRVVTRGINIEGVCNNPNCFGFNKFVLTKVGFGEWKNIYELDFKCPLCSQPTSQPWEPYFYRCKYETTISTNSDKDKDKTIFHKGDVEGEDVHHWDIHKKNIKIIAIEAKVRKLDNDPEPEHLNTEKKDNCCCNII